MPVAELKRPLSSSELKSRALMLRQALNLTGGKFTTGPSALAPLADNIFILGPSADIGLSDDFFAFGDALIRRISPFVIGSALCKAGSLPDVKSPGLSFRAAALANMSFRPLPSHNGACDDFSFEWEIGKLHWLPKH